MTAMFAEVIEELEADLHYAPADITDEMRLASLFAIIAKAHDGDPWAQATLAQLKKELPKLFDEEQPR